MARSDKKTKVSQQKKQQARKIIQRASEVFISVKEKVRTWKIPVKPDIKQLKDLHEKVKKYPYAAKAKELAYVLRLERIRGVWHTTSLKNAARHISESWRTLLLSLGSFLLFYYIIGSLVVEKIDVRNECRITTEKSTRFQTADCMAFLIRREVDDKMWTPNLPIFFPAYILDNMPNFQEGMISAVKDISAVLKKMDSHTQDQRTDLKEAHKLLTYSPKIWLLSRKGSFGIAPSANTQYRKAAKKLLRYNERAIFMSEKEDLLKLVEKINGVLLQAEKNSEEYIREHSSDWIDFKADDRFYYNKGYAFALWQIVRALGADYKQIILAHNLYTEWTYLNSSLQKAAEFKPYIVRNGEITSLTAPNHLNIQNYFLARAIIYGENIRYGLTAQDHAD